MELSVDNTSAHHFEVRYENKSLVIAPGQKFDLTPGQVQLYWEGNYVGNCSGFSWQLDQIDSGPAGTEYSVIGNNLIISDDDDEVSDSDNSDNSDNSDSE